VLIAAVLGPKKREDGELEVIRLPVEQIADPIELSVLETECAVERLFDDPRQESESSKPCGQSTAARFSPPEGCRRSAR
jgi:hypothetical protein